MLLHALVTISSALQHRPGVFATAARRASSGGITAKALPPMLDGLLSSNGATLEDPVGALAGKRVALYFSAGWCPMCTSFEPALDKYVAAAADAGTPIELSEPSPGI